MNQEKVTDEMLMAYADGELDTSEREQIAALAKADPAIAARIAQFARTGGLAREVFAPIHAEPVPADLIAAVTGGAPVARQDNSWLRTAMMPIAAMLVVVAGIGGYLAGAASPTAPAGGFLEAATSAPLMDALGQTPSGQTITVAANGLDIEAIATGTYETDAGYCRIYDASAGADAMRGVACTNGANWTVPVTVRVAGDGYQLASDATPMVIDSYLIAVGAGGDIGAEAEADRMAEDWALD